jgi:hypothetical protein
VPGTKKGGFQMMRRISFILIIAILITLSPVASADTILAPNDLIVNGEAHWAKPYIDRLIEKEIIVGYPDDTFKPNNNVEVDSYIKMVVCALGNNFENGKDNWASPFINKAIELKLIDNNEFNTYRRLITREEAAKVIIQALATTEELPSVEQINKYITKVPDYTKIADKYKQHGLYAYATGMITGDPKGNFNPKDNLTRAEAATIIMRLLDANLRKPIPVPDTTVALPELLKSDAEVWGKERMYEYTSTAFYTVENGKIYFKIFPSFENYELKDKLNPNIREQVYRATKVLIGDENYVYLQYITSDDGHEKVFLKYSESVFKAFNNHSYFNFAFEENKYYNARQDWSNKNFSEKSYLTLTVSRLWTEFDKDSWSTPYFETKLKRSILAIFGEVDGTEVYNYIYDMYTDKRNNPDKYVDKCFTKKIKNIQVDLANDDSSTLYFIFSKVGDN